MPVQWAQHLLRFNNQWLTAFAPSSISFFLDLFQLPWSATTCTPIFHFALFKLVNASNYFAPSTSIWQGLLMLLCNSVQNLQIFWFHQCFLPAFYWSDHIDCIRVCLWLFTERKHHEQFGNLTLSDKILLEIEFGNIQNGFHLMCQGKRVLLS